MSSSETTTYGVVLFRSVQGALAAEKRLVAVGIPHKLIAVPRHLSSNCGFCLRFIWNDRDRVAGILADGDLGIEATVAL